MTRGHEGVKPHPAEMGGAPFNIYKALQEFSNCSGGNVCYSSLSIINQQKRPGMQETQARTVSQVFTNMGIPELAEQYKVKTTAV